MKFSQQELIQIIAKASTISERLGNDFIINNTEINNKQINSRLENWRQVIAQGNSEKFAKRLAWDGLDVDTVAPILGTVNFAENALLPQWAETLQEIIHIASKKQWQQGESKAHCCLIAEDPLPFEDIYIPFIQVAQNKLNQRINELEAQGYKLQKLLSDNTINSLERGLLKRVAKLCAGTLALEFSIFRSFQQPSLNRLIGIKQGICGKEQYQKFVEKLLSDGLKSFFQEYSVLARLVAVAVDFWVDATTEFLQRLASDLQDIQQNFQAGESNLGQIIAIEPALSDSHNQGRHVIALTFASGLKLIYKPKDLGIEVAYFELLDWCNHQDVPLPFKIIKVLNRSNYGWVEFVEYLPCDSEAAAQRFYQRAGMLTCMLYILAGTDCHYENLIASGEHLVLIDPEMLMQPREREETAFGDGEAQAESIAKQLVFDSVLSTGMLPRWEFEQNNQAAYDISGLGGVGEQKINYRARQWRDINTDNMELVVSESVSLPSQANTPILNGKPLSPNDYVSELVDGFQLMYRFLMQKQAALLDSESPLASFIHQHVRFVCRPTQIYTILLNQTFDPKYLRDGADWSIALDVLSRGFLVSEEKASLLPILAVEKQAMEQLDIPFFTIACNSDGMTVAPNQVIEQCFQEPSYNRVIESIRTLSECNLNQQVAIIKSSLYSRVARINITTSRNEELTDTIVPLTQEQLIEQAVKIGRELQQRAIYAADGGATWIGMTYIHDAQRFQFQPIGYNLGDGCAGVALFLAALEKMTPGAGFRDLALSALLPIRQMLQNSQSYSKIAKKIGMGGAVGLGSLIYALVRSSQFLGEPTLLEDAKHLASLITPNLIASDRSFDITVGSAGTILGLLALYDAVGEQFVLEVASSCGEHLLNHRTTSSDSGFKAWATINGKLITGFSHGAAGIACALLRLYQVTKRTDFLQAALEAIEYERQVFSPTAGNWPDFRPHAIIDGKPTFNISWCHGAPGIGLSRLDSLAIINTDEIRQEIEIALQTTQKCSWQEIDNLCCGNLGRIDVLLTASLKLNRPEILEKIHKQVSWIVNRAEREGTFCISPQLPRDAYTPGFFQGVAGIGYELLRLAHPDLLPSVLLFN